MALICLKKKKLCKQGVRPGEYLFFSDKGTNIPLRWLYRHLSFQARQDEALLKGELSRSD